MHFNSSSADNVTSTFQKNLGNLMDAIWYGKLYQKMLYASRTHGGFIEDEFKKYLLKLPAGDLVNSPELARFMPTAKERIEALKRQVKADPDNEVLQQAAAAEIIAIRNACGVEWKNGYGLDKHIPAAPDGKRLADEARKLKQDVACRIILRDESTIEEGYQGPQAPTA